MKKVAFLLSVLIVVMLAASCSGKSSKGDKDDDDDETETTTEFSLADMEAAFKKALNDCAGWSAADALRFHKEKTQMLTEFYESDPTPQKWLDFRNMEQKYIIKMETQMDLTSYGDWPYQQMDRFRLDSEAKDMDAKLKKVYTKWKKAHADELAEVIARPVEQETEIEEEEEIIFEDTDSLTDSPYYAEEEAEQEPEDNTIYNVVEQPPFFPEGDVKTWIERHMNYPADARDMGIRGTVVCQFVVEKDGSISGATLIRKADPSLDQEALRLVNAMPRWIPGKQNGRAVRVRYTLPVKFKLE